jgi:hypothetical protein
MALCTAASPATIVPGRRSHTAAASTSTARVLRSAPAAAGAGRAARMLSAHAVRAPRRARGVVRVQVSTIIRLSGPRRPYTPLPPQLSVVDSPRVAHEGLAFLSARTGRIQAHAGALPPVQFDGMSPEQKAAVSLKTFFTMVAVRIVLDHVRALASPNDKEIWRRLLAPQGLPSPVRSQPRRRVQIPLRLARRGPQERIRRISAAQVHDGQR